MKRAARKRSINGKLSRLVVLAVGVAMLFVAVFGCWQETYRYLAGKRDALTATATAFAAASADAVALHDRRSAFLAIRGIGSLSAIDFAALSDGDGRPLAGIGSGVRLAGDLDLTVGDTAASPLDLLGTRTVSVTVPVKKGGMNVGSLKIVGHLGDLWSRLREVLLTTAFGALAALAIGLGISLRLQRSIIRPLIALTSAMSSIQTNHDYDTRVVIDSDDEIGLLAASFNGMIGEVRDRDRRLIAHRDQLEHDVAERTHDLKSAKEDAEAANAAKSTFLATMSHEIRTPMTGLLVMAELLASGDLPTRSRRYADVICRSGTALLAIINDILDFSKIEAGKLETERVRVDIREVVGTVINLFYARAIEKNLDLAASIAPDVPAAIEGDPVRLQQIISNLVNNALKFTKTGHVLVTVEYAGGRLVCDVVDTGIGIAAEKLERIFQAFSQADGSTTREFGGTGLGLSISSRLSEAMGGAISVESRPGVGSTFTCTVPATALEAPPSWGTLRRGSRRPRAILSIAAPATARAVAAALDSAGYEIDPVSSASDGGSADLLVVDDSAGYTAKVSPGRTSDIIHLSAPGAIEPEAQDGHVLKLPFLEGDLRRLLEEIASGTAAPSRKGEAVRQDADAFAGARVLVADDMAVNREVMIEALSRFGIVPDLVENGRDAVEAALARSYDLVLMDGSMPELDGFEACRLLRGNEPPGQRTPVVAVTAHVVGTAANAWRDAGMDGILHKPFTMAELRRTLGAFLRPSEAAVTDPTDPLEVAEPGAADTLLDASVLQEIMSVSAGTNQDFARRVLQLFVDHVPQGLASIATAISHDDQDALAKASHAIKSMCLNIGAKQAASAAAAVERSARAGVNDAAAVATMRDLLGRTIEHIAVRLKSIAPDIERRVNAG